MAEPLFDPAFSAPFSVGAASAVLSLPANSNFFPTVVIGNPSTTDDIWFSFVPAVTGAVAVPANGTFSGALVCMRGTCQAFALNGAQFIAMISSNGGTVAATVALGTGS